MTSSAAPVDPVAELGRAVDAVLAMDPSALPDEVVEQGVMRLMGETARLAAARARFIGDWEARALWAADGSRSPSAALAHRAGVSAATARVECRRARKLCAMPDTAAALAAGEIGVDHVDVLCAARDDSRAESFTRDEHLLVGHAKTLSFPEFTRAVRYWRQCADDTGDEDRARRLHHGRRFDASATFQGTVELGGSLDAVDGGIFRTELQRLEQDLFLADWAAARAAHGDQATVDHLPRTPTQRRADALVEMARRSAAMPAHHRPARPLITVLVGYETFAGRICELSDGTVLTPGQVAGLLTEANIERVVFDGPSRVIDVGERRRFFTGALRRAIEVRDRHCTHPGCDVPAEHCQVDHIIEYATGGLTTQANGRLLCPAHNRHRRRTPSDEPP